MQLPHFLSNKLSRRASVHMRYIGQGRIDNFNYQHNSRHLTHHSCSAEPATLEPATVPYAKPATCDLQLSTAATVSAALAQIGEFPFILVALGLSLRLLPPEAQSLIVAGALLSITLNPLVFFIVSKCFKKQTPATTRS
jgi:hypothetical protein